MATASLLPKTQQLESATNSSATYYNSDEEDDIIDL